MDSICSARISAAVTGRRPGEMSLQNGEIRRQPGPFRKLVMDSRASHDTYRAAGFMSLKAPPAPILVKADPVVPTATAPGNPARMPGGAGIVVRAGFVVAPVLLGDGPGIPFASERDSIRCSVTDEAQSPQTETGMSYLAPGRGNHGARVSIRMPGPGGPASGSVRGDRSFHRPFRSPEGTRSRDRRDVSLSPVPAPHIVRGAPCRHQLPRIHRRAVAKQHP